MHQRSFLFPRAVRQRRPGEGPVSYTHLIINNISYVPVVNPEIITGVSLMLLFVMAQNFGIGGESGIFGWTTLLIAHITFNIPYVIFNVGPKLRQLDPSLYNAALDLGCTPKQAFMKVIMPQLSPAILSAFLICLTYSIDDFMISYFNSGTMQTLPIAIYSMTVSYTHLDFCHIHFTSLCG